MRKRERGREKHIICLYATYIYKQKHADIHTHATLATFPMTYHDFELPGSITVP